MLSSCLFPVSQINDAHSVATLGGDGEFNQTILVSLGSYNRALQIVIYYIFYSHTHICIYKTNLYVEDLEDEGGEQCGEQAVDGEAERGEGSVAFAALHCY